jgi:hypothetical protein
MSTLLCAIAAVAMVGAIVFAPQSATSATRTAAAIGLFTIGFTLLEIAAPRARTVARICAAVAAAGLVVSLATTFVARSAGHEAVNAASVFVLNICFPAVLSALIGRVIAHFVRSDKQRSIQ